MPLVFCHRQKAEAAQQESTFRGQECQAGPTSICCLRVCQIHPRPVPVTGWLAQRVDPEQRRHHACRPVCLHAIGGTGGCGVGSNQLYAPGLVPRQAVHLIIELQAPALIHRLYEVVLGAKTRLHPAFADSGSLGHFAYGQAGDAPLAHQRLCSVKQLVAINNGRSGHLKIPELEYDRIVISGRHS